MIELIFLEPRMDLNIHLCYTEYSKLRSYGSSRWCQGLYCRDNRARYGAHGDRVIILANSQD